MAANENTTVLTASLTAYDPFGDAANEAVQDVRALDAPVGAYEVFVGGQTALNLRATMDSLPLVLALIVGATLLLMFLVFGSVLLSIKAVGMTR